jgi:1-acyl-sn-glycerol-3-phosphate acyltransferase
MAGRNGFGAMDQAALQKYRFMARIGVFGVEPESYRSTAAFLRTATEVLNDPTSVLWMTAEGHFADCRARPIALQPGTAHLAARLDRIDVIPMAIEYSFWDERLPEALCRFGAPVIVSQTQSVDAWQQRLRESLTEAMDALSASAMTRDPARFHTILDGNVGVGGIYDLWRRARAALRGEAFSAGHGAQDR